MMLQYVMGYGKPLFRVYNNGTLVDTITFPLTMQPNGLTETWKEESLTDIVIPLKIDLNNYSSTILKQSLGWRGTFTFDYVAHMNNNSIINCLKKIQDYESNGFTLMLYPREDNRRRKFKVIQTPGWEINFNIKGGGANAKGMRNIQLQYVCTDLVKYIDISDPNAIQYNALRTNPRFCLVNS